MLNMPVPTRRKNERRKDFIDRCMGDDTMNKDFDDVKQRYAVCIRQSEKQSKACVDIDWDDLENKFQDLCNRE